MEVEFAPFGKNLTLYILLVYEGFLYTLFLKDLFRFIGQLSTSFADGRNLSVQFLLNFNEAFGLRKLF